jgi:hypothetical protein
METSAVSVGLLIGDLAGAILLILGAMHGLQNPRRLLASLISHELLHYRWCRRVAFVGPSVQAVLGIALLLIVLVGGGLPSIVRQTILGTGVAAWLAMMAYLSVLLLHSPSAHCICFGRPQPVNGLSLLRIALPAGCMSGSVLAGLPTSVGLNLGAVTSAVGLSLILVAAPRVPNALRAQREPTRSSLASASHDAKAA